MKIMKAYLIKHYYDNIDRENKIKNKYLNKEFVPILRAKEGLMMKDYSYLYKVTFNDSMLLDDLHELLARCIKY